jgi:hypothetical protein
VRRRLVAAAAAFLLSACGALLPADPTDCAFLGRVGTFAPETVTRAACAPVYVVQHDGALTVFLARTPHLDGEGLQWMTAAEESINPSPGAVLSADGTFWSFAHGERFDVTGAIAEPGPASRELWECPSEVRGNQLWVEGPPDASVDEIVTICKRDS